MTGRDLCPIRPFPSSRIQPGYSAGLPSGRPSRTSCTAHRPSCAVEYKGCPDGPPGRSSECSPVGRFGHRHHSVHTPSEIPARAAPPGGAGRSRYPLPAEATRVAEAIPARPPWQAKRPQDYPGIRVLNALSRSRFILPCRAAGSVDQGIFGTCRNAANAVVALHARRSHVGFKRIGADSATLPAASAAILL